MCAIYLLSLINLGLHILSDGAPPMLLPQCQNIHQEGPAQTLVCDLRCKENVSNNNNNNYHLVRL